MLLGKAIRLTVEWILVSDNDNGGYWCIGSHILEIQVSLFAKKINARDTHSKDIKVVWGLTMIFVYYESGWSARYPDFSLCQGLSCNIPNVNGGQKVLYRSKLPVLDPQCCLRVQGEFQSIHWGRLPLSAARHAISLFSQERGFPDSTEISIPFFCNCECDDTSPNPNPDSRA